MKNYLKKIYSIMVMFFYTPILIGYLIRFNFLFRSNFKSLLLGLRQQVRWFGENNFPWTINTHGFFFWLPTYGKFSAPLGDSSTYYIVNEIIFGNEYDLELLLPSDFVLDLGANFGLFSRIAAFKCQNVVALEPNTYVGNFLTKNAIDFNRQKNINVILKGIGVSDNVIMGNFKVHGSAAGSSVYKNDPTNIFESWSVLSTKSLQSLLEINPTVIKMDIEGLEEDVLLKGKLIELFTPRVIFIEYHSLEIFKNISLYLEPNYKIFDKRSDKITTGVITGIRIN